LYQSLPESTAVYQTSRRPLAFVACSALTKFVPGTCYFYQFVMGMYPVGVSRFPQACLECRVTWVDLGESHEHHRPLRAKRPGCCLRGAAITGCNGSLPAQRCARRCSKGYVRASAAFHWLRDNFAHSEAKCVPPSSPPRLFSVWSSAGAAVVPWCEGAMPELSCQAPVMNGQDRPFLRVLPFPSVRFALALALALLGVCKRIGQFWA
jgi:hypothetical protein